MWHLSGQVFHHLHEQFVFLVRVASIIHFMSTTFVRSFIINNHFFCPFHIIHLGTVVKTILGLSMNAESGSKQNKSGNFLLMFLYIFLSVQYAIELFFQAVKSCSALLLHLFQQLTIFFSLLLFFCRRGDGAGLVQAARKGRSAGAPAWQYERRQDEDVKTAAGDLENE